MCFRLFYRCCSSALTALLDANKYTLFDVWYVVVLQFVVCIRRNGQTIYQRVLSVHDAPKSGLSAWQWRFPKQRALYHALYPRAWTVYEIVECNVTLVCRQVSPIFPHDYKVCLIIYCLATYANPFR